jgi:hypothetical protein
MTEIQKFTKYLEGIAAIYFEAYEHTDRDGVVTERNRKGFVQDKLLNGICYQLANAIDYSSNKTLPQAKAAVQRTMRAHDGTEISELNLQRSVEWVQRLNEQLAFDQAMLDAAKRVYTKATGKDFAYGRTARPNEDVAETPAMAAAKALGIVTNVAPGHNSNAA